MKNEERILIEQRKRLIQVFDYLRLIGINQSTICNELSKNQLNYNESKLSHIKSGKIKYIPQDLLKELHKSHNINPDFVRLNSDYMFDISWKEFEGLNDFVKSWNTVIVSEKRCLKISIKPSFYEFLKNVGKAELIRDNFSDFNEIISNIKAKYQADDKFSDFFIIPKDYFMEIVQGNDALEESYIGPLELPINENNQKNIKLKLNLT